MTGLVIELQRDALNHEIKVSNLLRKALVISKKLGITENDKWINNELKGYLPDDEVPSYRVVYGQVKAFNPFQGRWIPVLFKTDEFEELFSKTRIDISIIEIESLIENDGYELQATFSSYIENELMKIMKEKMQPSLIIGKTKFINMLDIVRSNILDWTLELEQQGILGVGMTFSNEEKKAASQITYNIGTMQNSQIQHDSAHATQSLNVTEANSVDLKNLVEELKKAVDSFQLSQEQFSELKEAIAMLEIQANSAKPNNLIIKESGRTVRNILEGMTGSIAASGLIYQLGLFVN